MNDTFGVSDTPPTPVPSCPEESCRAPHRSRSPTSPLSLHPAPLMLPPMGASSYTDIKRSLAQLYLDDSRSWLVGFGGGKDSTTAASLVVQIGTSTSSCSHSRLGCRTCTVVERDKVSDRLLASGDERMQKLVEFREMVLNEHPSHKLASSG